MTTSGIADYCVSCVRRRGYSRMDVLTEPEAVKQTGGSGLVAMYVCPLCAHRWTCCWTAEMWVGAG